MTAIPSKISFVRKGLSALVLAGALAATIAGTSSAHANPVWPDHFWAPGLGLGMGLLAASAATTAYGPQCQWVREYDIDGNYVRQSRVCE
ncbi:MAG TPA: hypothetical protein VGG12_05370 [Methylovirgula sp.]|jgi:hypothetical protein